MKPACFRSVSRRSTRWSRSANASHIASISAAFTLPLRNAAICSVVRWRKSSRIMWPSAVAARRPSEVRARERKVASSSCPMQCFMVAV